MTLYELMTEFEFADTKQFHDEVLVMTERLVSLGPGLS